MRNDSGKNNSSEAVVDQVKTAVGKAQEEIGKRVGSLVKEGEKLREQTLKLAGDAAGELKERVEEVRDLVESAKTKAGGTLDNLEQLFEERVARALKQLGVPTHDDLQSIAQRLDEINSRIKVLVNNRPVGAAPAREPEKDKEPEKDDLKLINGIGPALEGKLNAAGISRYDQLALLSAADIERIESEVIHFSGRIRRDDWIRQAREWYARKYGMSIDGE